MSIFGKKKNADKGEEAATAKQCSHAELAPRWDSAADMGKRDLITSYTCAGCGQSLSKEEAETLRAGR